jgi:TRAP-type uncharacterized transport system substrate-binding protein
MNSLKEEINTIDQAKKDALTAMSRQLDAQAIAATALITGQSPAAIKEAFTAVGLPFVAIDDNDLAEMLKVISDQFDSK